MLPDITGLRSAGNARSSVPAGSMMPEEFEDDGRSDDLMNRIRAL